MKVHIRTTCSFCDGEAYLPVREAVIAPRDAASPVPQTARGFSVLPGRRHAAGVL